MSIFSELKNMRVGGLDSFSLTSKDPDHPFHFFGFERVRAEHEGDELAIYELSHDGSPIYLVNYCIGPSSSPELTAFTSLDSLAEWAANNVPQGLLDEVLTKP